MSYVPSRKFCCCLPVRLGVIIIALLGLIVGGFVAGSGIYLATKLVNPTPLQKGAFAIAIIVYALYAIMSVLALVGALAKKRGLIRVFFIFLTIHVLLLIGTGAFSLYALFQDSPATVAQCVQLTSASDAVAACQKTADIFKGLAVAFVIIIWLMAIWGCVIVNDYTKQLEEEDMVRRKDAAYLNA